MIELAATSADELHRLQATLGHVRKLALLGPEGTWTHQAALELWPGTAVRCLFMPVAEMFAALEQRAVDAVLLPARTSIVGDTPYMPVLQELLMREGVASLASYARMLGYCLLAKSAMPLHDVQRVLAHPVALAEAAPWLDLRLPNALRVECQSAGEAAQLVAQAADASSASLGPALAGELHGLTPLATGIEEGRHNVTEWWVVGRTAADAH